MPWMGAKPAAPGAQNSAPTKSHSQGDSIIIFASTVKHDLENSGEEWKSTTLTHIFAPHVFIPAWYSKMPNFYNIFSV